MKALPIDIQTNATTTYDQTKPYLGGRTFIQTLLNGKSVVAPRLPRFIDVQTDTSGSVVFGVPTMYLSVNNKLYIANAPVAGVGTIILYTYNVSGTSAGNWAYIGRVNYVLPNLAASVHTIKNLEVRNDSGTTGFQILVTTTATGVVINGTLFKITCDQAHFQPTGGLQIPFATGPNQSPGVQMLIESFNGSLNTMTAAFGSLMDSNKYYVFSGAGTFTAYRFDLSLSQTTTPQAVTSVSNQAAAGAFYNFATAHGYVAGDQVLPLPPQISSITVGANTTITTTAAHGFIAGHIVQIFQTFGALPTGLATGTNYYVIATGLTANSFQLSLSLGGAAITTSGIFSGFGFVGYMPMGVVFNTPSFVIAGGLTSTALTISATSGGVAITGTANTISTIAGTTLTASAALNAALIVNAPIQFYSTGTYPTGISANTNYYVLTTATPNFTISATPGGAAMSPGTSWSGSMTVGVVNNGNFTVYSGFGQTKDFYEYKTGTQAALSGTLLVNAVDRALPQHTTNAGSVCAYIGTTTTNYLGKLAELTSGAVTWPSLIAANNLPSLAQNTVVPTTAFANWMDAIDRVILSVTAAAVYNSRFIIKQLFNTVSDSVFGVANNLALEASVMGTAKDGYEVGSAGIAATEARNGWYLMFLTTVNQRGILVADLKCDPTYDLIDGSTNSSFFITPVINTLNANLVMVAVQQQIRSLTNRLKLQYRTSGFSSPTGGWVDVPSPDQDLTTIPTPTAITQIQFKGQFILFEVSSCVPALVSMLYLLVQPTTEMSDYWDYDTTRSAPAGVPSTFIFRQKQQFISAPAQQVFRFYDTSLNLLITLNSASSPSNFTYSTDGGTTWLPLGTIPNAVNTLLKVIPNSPPGVDGNPSLRES